MKTVGENVLEVKNWDKLWKQILWIRLNLISTVKFIKLSVLIYWYSNSSEVMTVLLKWSYCYKLMKSSVISGWKWNGLNIHIAFLTVHSEDHGVIFLPISRFWWKYLKVFVFSWHSNCLRYFFQFLFPLFCSRGKILW